MHTTHSPNITRLVKALEAGYPVSESNLIRAMQTLDNQTPCFRSEIRHTCENTGCEWLQECKRMVAEWRSNN